MAENKNETMNTLPERVEPKGKKEAPAATAADEKKTYTDADLKQDSRKTAALLAKYPKVRIRMPLPEGVTERDVKEGKVDYSETVMINGHVTRIMRGHWVEVPEPVAEVLERAGKI